MAKQDIYDYRKAWKKEAARINRQHDPCPSCGTPINRIHRVGCDLKKERG